VVAHTSDPSTQELRQEDHVFEASLGCIARACLKKKAGASDSCLSS
jgi:hypothetical protein